jgi:Icc-related predicted phosphoesterase
VIGIIGDLHGRFDALDKLFREHSEVTSWFQVGDIGAESLSYPEFPSNFHFIHGNHENWDDIEALSSKDSPLYLQNGRTYSFKDGENAFTVASLGGNYSSNFYHKHQNELCGDRRRHFVEDEVEMLMKSTEKVDILFTHEAPVPFRKGNREMGQPIITELVKKLHPTVHFFGHHHYFTKIEQNGTVSTGLEYGWKSFGLYDIPKNEFKSIIC